MFIGGQEESTHTHAHARGYWPAISQDAIHLAALVQSLNSVTNRPVIKFMSTRYELCDPGESFDSFDSASVISSLEMRTILLPVS